MRIIVSDSSCLIDLRKASLLDVFLRLPYEILIPNTLFEDELLRFSSAQKALLLQGGLQVFDAISTGPIDERRDAAIGHSNPGLGVSKGQAKRNARSG